MLRTLSTVSINLVRKKKLLLAMATHMMELYIYHCCHVIQHCSHKAPKY